MRKVYQGLKQRLAGAGGVRVGEARAANRWWVAVMAGALALAEARCYAEPNPPAVIMSAAVNPSDPIAGLLLHGQFQAGLDGAKAELGNPTADLALRLYEQGLAQMGLAQAAGSRDLYEDAGLSFMRVVIFFPQSRYAGPSLIEAGVVHEMIGRTDLAKKLWERAKLQIDETQEPQLDAWLEKLMTASNQRATAKANKVE